MIFLPLALVVVLAAEAITRVWGDQPGPAYLILGWLTGMVVGPLLAEAVLSLL